MIQSMTGFSTKNIVLELPDSHRIYATITLKSLNARFFEANCKLPFALSHLEVEIIKRCKAQLVRGTIYCTINIGQANSLQTKVIPAWTVAESYIAAAKSLQEKFDIPGTLTITEVVRFPNIFEFQEQVVDERVYNQVLTAMDVLLSELVIIREKEGMVLKKDLESRTVLLKKYFELLQIRTQEIFNDRKNETAELIAQINRDGIEKSPEIYALQVALDKVDVHEEVVRFKNHLENLNLLLEQAGKEKGKKIDFTLQELFREINTIAAKCPDSVISGLAIDIKVELEKMREQAQNIV